MKTETIDGFAVPQNSLQMGLENRMYVMCNSRESCIGTNCNACIFYYMHITPAREKAFLKWEAKQWVK